MPYDKVCHLQSQTHKAIPCKSTTNNVRPQGRMCSWDSKLRESVCPEVHPISLPSCVQSCTVISRRLWRHVSIDVDSAFLEKKSCWAKLRGFSFRLLGEFPQAPNFKSQSFCFFLFFFFKVCFAVPSTLLTVAQVMATSSWIETSKARIAKSKHCPEQTRWRQAEIQAQSVQSCRRCVLWTVSFDSWSCKARIYCRK